MLTCSCCQQQHWCSRHGAPQYSITPVTARHAASGMKGMQWKTKPRSSDTAQHTLLFIAYPWRPDGVHECRCNLRTSSVQVEKHTNRYKILPPHNHTEPRKHHRRLMPPWHQLLRQSNLCGQGSGLSRSRGHVHGKHVEAPSSSARVHQAA
jgi:hypothetical protein